MSLGTTLARFEKERLRDLLDRHGWRIGPAAKAGGMHFDTLKKRMAEYGLTRPATVPVRRSRAKTRATEFRKVADWTWEAIAP